MIRRILRYVNLIEISSYVETRRQKNAKSRENLPSQAPANLRETVRM